MYLGLERKLTDKASLLLSIAANQIEVTNTSVNFWNTTLSFNYNLNDFIFKPNSKFDFTLGSGFGLYNASDINNITLVYRENLTYWITNKFGVTMQHQGNISTPNSADDKIKNFHQLFFGAKLQP